MAAEESVGGIHHVTAITGDAGANLDFYTRVLGLRLVKKTVNQDDVSAYHLFYGDTAGHPGTEVTFFHWPAAPRNGPGYGSFARIALAVPGESALDWWEHRLTALGVTRAPAEVVAGQRRISLQDPEGQRLELVDAGAGARPDIEPWEGSPVPTAMAIRGVAAVTLEVAAPAPTLSLLTGVLGFRRVAAYVDGGAAVTVLECGAGGTGTRLRLAVPRLARPGAPGVGGVHHVAFRTADAESQQVWHRRVGQTGLPCSSVVDRYYFRSVYFREPGGALCEIATDGPGFGTDEPLAHLGERLSLPPFLEPRRAEIEAGLPPLGAEAPAADA